MAMNKGVSIYNYNELLREIVAEVKMTRVVIANRLSVSLSQKRLHNPRVPAIIKCNSQQR